MALDSFFQNKIESMKLEIIQGQAVLRRLEAQRNDYNSRGIDLATLDSLRSTIPSTNADFSLLLQYDYYEKSLGYCSNRDPTSARSSR